VKWGRLPERAARLGFDAVATGHHVRVVHTAAGPRIARGADAAKDQSYVLAVLAPEAVERTLLPVGELTKVDVRARAARLGLRTATKPDSMDVCFIARGGRREFLASRAAAVPGRVVDPAGRRMGAHDGIVHFTIGQRRGVGVAVGERRYVVDVDARTATVTLGRRADLLRPHVVLRDATFPGERPAGAVLAQLRAHGHPVAARLDGDTVRFAAPQPRVAPGQVVALYDGDVVVGAGYAT
jgi:tRNA-specific 2-thiouridylase